MLKGARRLLSRPLRPYARRALLALCLWIAGSATAGDITSAMYEGLTDRYPHAVLGDDLEFTTLVIFLDDGSILRHTLPETRVFEDTEPRVIDLDHDGAPEVIVVESDAQRGARLAVFGADGRITATPYIGTRFRWLAPLGAADLDADGKVEIAYVDRPHLAKTLRVWRYHERALSEVGIFPGVTNHRIGETDIAGGLRTCGEGPEMILADAAWGRLLAIRFDGFDFASQIIGRDTSREAFARAMACAANP